MSAPRCAACGRVHEHVSPCDTVALLERFRDLVLGRTKGALESCARVLGPRLPTDKRLALWDGAEKARIGGSFVGLGFGGPSYPSDVVPAADAFSRYVDDLLIAAAGDQFDEVSARLLDAMRRGK